MTCRCQYDHRSQPGKESKMSLTYIGKLEIILAVLLGKLDLTGLLVRRKVLPNGQWQTPGKKTKEHGKHTPLFYLSASWGLVPGTFLKLHHSDLDSYDTTCWNMKYSCFFTQFQSGVHLISSGHLGSLCAKAVDLERNGTLGRNSQPRIRCHQCKFLDPCPGTSERTINVYRCHCKLLFLLFCYLRKGNALRKDLLQNEDDKQLLGTVPFVLVWYMP